MENHHYLPLKQASPFCINETRLEMSLAKTVQHGEVVWGHANTQMSQKVDILWKSSSVSEIFEHFTLSGTFIAKPAIKLNTLYEVSGFLSNLKFWNFWISEKHKAWVEFSAQLSWRGKKLKSSRNPSGFQL